MRLAPSVIDVELQSGRKCCFRFVGTRRSTHYYTTDVIIVKASVIAEATTASHPAPQHGNTNLYSNAAATTVMALWLYLKICILKLRIVKCVEGADEIY